MMAPATYGDRLVPDKPTGNPGAKEVATAWRQLARLSILYRRIGTRIRQDALKERRSRQLSPHCGDNWTLASAGATARKRG